MDQENQIEQYQQHLEACANYVVRVAKPMDNTKEWKGKAADDIVKAIGDVGCVMIGESTHGTQEFYDLRASLTKKLIEEKDFSIVCIEGDWPPVERVHNYVCGHGSDKSAMEALSKFKGVFPEWMWRNHCFVDFIEWLRDYNSKHPDSMVGLYGLDMQHCMGNALNRVYEFFEQYAPKEMVEQVYAMYSSLQPYSDDTEANSGYNYGDDVLNDRLDSQDANVMIVENLITVLGESSPDVKNANRGAFFSAARNAALVRAWECYYRVGAHRLRDRSTWDIRDQSFFDTLIASRQQHGGGNVVVWAHNSHLGDASATELADRELNLGQLVRGTFGVHNTFSVGFSTYCNEVTASTHWGGPTLRRTMNDALRFSYGDLFHRVKQLLAEQKSKEVNAFAVVMRRNDGMQQSTEDVAAMEALLAPRVQRAIGVQYKKETERQSHYFQTCLPLQFDCMIHIDSTNALVPLDGWKEDKE